MDKTTRGNLVGGMLMVSLLGGTATYLKTALPIAIAAGQLARAQFCAIIVGLLTGLIIFGVGSMAFIIITAAIPQR